MGTKNFFFFFKQKTAYEMRISDWSSDVCSSDLQIYTDLQTYFHWLAKGAPTDTKLKGAGFIKLKETKLGYDPGRGAQVFQQNCASCHGADGQGQRDINGRVVFPPLWGPHSYNWGAGMASVKNAAAFVKKNMPLDRKSTRLNSSH